MSGKGAKGFMGGKAPAQTRIRTRRSPISRSSRAGLQTSQQQASQCLLLFLLVIAAYFPHPTRGDVGTAAHYAPPYLPTACHGNDDTQIPPNNMFAAAGEAVCDNGASCGRRYSLICIGATTPGACKPSRTIQVRIIDCAQTSKSRPSASGATLVLSRTAFGAIANLSASSVKIMFQQV